VIRVFHIKGRPIKKKGRLDFILPKPRKERSANRLLRVKAATEKERRKKRFRQNFSPQPKEKRERKDRGQPSENPPCPR